MFYKVTKKYGQGPETPGESFKTLDEAVAFAQQSAESDAAMKIQTIYRIYEFDDLLREIDSTKIEIGGKQDQAEQSSQGAGQTSGFRPTPLNTAPRPKGAIQPWDKKDKDEDE